MSERAKDMRWGICVHEAGHAVAAKHLLDTTDARAVVFDVVGGVGGLTHDGGKGRIPATFGGAVVIAAGKAAERFAATTTPPKVTEEKPVVKLETKAPLEAARLAKHAPAIPSDEQSLAEWCVAVNPSARTRPLDPRRWRERLITAKWAARRFVVEHRSEILRVAERLYMDGVVVLEDMEERK